MYYDINIFLVSGFSVHPLYPRLILLLLVSCKPSLVMARKLSRYYFIFVNLSISCCHKHLLALVKGFQKISGCDCILVPLFFHCVSSVNRHHYDSLSLELFPVYSCSRHQIHSDSVKPEKPSRPNSPRRLVRFSSNGTFTPVRVPTVTSVKAESVDPDLIKPLSLDDCISTSSTVALVSDSESAPAVKGASFRHVPFKEPSVPPGSSVIFTNRS